jgi:hypothetical protein
MGSTTSQRSRCCGRRDCKRLLSAFFLLLALILYTFLTKDGYLNGRMEDDPEPLYNLQGDTNADGSSSSSTTTDDNNGAVVLPKALIDMGIYRPDSDFENSRGVVPPFWSADENVTSSTATNKEDMDSRSPPLDLQSWGPCYPPHSKIHWKNDTQQERPGQQEKEDQHYKYRHKARDNVPIQDFTSVQGGCRPGFLIIGAGKCGTSSLYHYLVGHPRVAPAYSKQIHYFKVRKKEEKEKGRIID